MASEPYALQSVHWRPGANYASPDELGQIRGVGAPVRSRTTVSLYDGPQVKQELLRVTEVLAIAGAANYDFVTEEGKWKGSETHRAAELLDRGRLKKCPEHVAGRLEAYRRAKVELHFVPDPDGIERPVTLTRLGVVGRTDRTGTIGGARCIVDLKSGHIQPATALQLCLYGIGVDASVWWRRLAIELRDDGTYRPHKYPHADYWSDLVTAQSCVRLAQWKLKVGLYKREK
jgi:hypothetical protein